MSITPEQHLERLEMVLERLKRVNVKLKRDTTDGLYAASAI